MMLSFVAFTMTMMAVPAKRGMWKMLTLSNGTEVRAQLVGDEHGHYWLSEDGTAYREVSGTDRYEAIDVQQAVAKANARRAKANARRTKRLGSHRVVVGEQTHYTGEKKGLVILMNFKDTKFKTANNLAKYKDILNKENYNVSPFQGSVADYFKAQSTDANGESQFVLTFDVVGPYTALKNYSYYGTDSGAEGNDQHPDELVVEAVQAAAADAEANLNFADYDWDGDGEVDQVFILYAGKGQADGGAANTIWPHMWYLSGTNMQQEINGVTIDTYACSNEIMSDGTIEGIGCFCHEFSHCMGFPDFYDTSYSGWYGMGSWDLMCSGSYNGNTYKPAGYNAYEKWMSGWLEPIELTEDVKVENLKALSDGGDAYILYNSGHRDEYYTIENRQKKGWDAELPGKGLMIVHVDFDSNIWQENNPNTKVTQQDVNDYAAEGYTIHANDHQRFALFCADNKPSDYSESNDLYPYGNKNSLTATSTPKASLYNTNAAGTKLMEKGITAITQNADGTMSFVYGDPDNPENPENPDPIINPDLPEGTLLSETFDNLDGEGGNDGKWSGSLSMPAIDLTDSESPLYGWTSDNGKVYAGNKCVKLGTSSLPGIITTPAMTVSSTAKLTFRAGAWKTTDENTTLKLSVSNGTIEPAEVTMKTGEFTAFEATITVNNGAAPGYAAANSNVKVTFATEGAKARFFLDDVDVKAAGATSISEKGIVKNETATAATDWYTLDGRRLSGQPVNKGLYIVNGKKYIVK